MPIAEEGLQNPDAFIYTHSGRKAGPSYIAPPLEDIAVSLGRLCRFAGHGRRWFPVILHSFIVADLVPEEHRGVALLHDAAEMVTGDVPTPFKGYMLKGLEDLLLDRLFQAHLGHKLDKKSKAWLAVKEADSESFLGEVHTIGNSALRGLYSQRSKRAEKLVRKYLKKYPFEDCISSEGQAVADFVLRVKDCQ